jgi:hypothetical protein
MVDRRCIPWLCCTLCLIWLDFGRFRLYDPGRPLSPLTLISHSLLFRNVVIDFILFHLTGAVHPLGETLLMLPIIIGVGMVLSIHTLPWIAPGHGQNLLHNEETENVLHNDQAHPVGYLPLR